MTPPSVRRGAGGVRDAGNNSEDAPSAEYTETQATPSRFSIHLLHHLSISMLPVWFYDARISLKIRELDALAVETHNPTIQ